VERVFYSAFVLKCTDVCKHRFGVQLLKNPPLCSSTFASYPLADLMPQLQSSKVKLIMMMMSRQSSNPIDCNDYDVCCTEGESATLLRRWSCISIAISIQRTGSVNPYFSTATIQCLRYTVDSSSTKAQDGIFEDSQIVVKHGIEMSVRIFRLVTETITTLYM
jgi:hypothetical protein